MSPETDEQADYSQRQAGVSRVGKGAVCTYLPPLLVLHPLSIHDAYCEERRKKGLTRQSRGRWGGPWWGRLASEDSGLGNSVGSVGRGINLEKGPRT